MPLPLRFGLFLGLSQLVATLGVWAFGLHSSPEALNRAQMPESLAGFVLLMLVLGLAHRASKKASLARGEAEQSFGASARFAFVVALVGGICTGLGQWLYATFINPGLVEIQRSIILQKVGAEMAKLAPEDAAQMARHIDFATSPLARGLLFAVNTLLFATLLGLAYALIFRAAAKRDQAAAGKTR